jgi:hypothetical protein
MIKLFRKIRQKLIAEENLRKYAFYAIGEILLVVIGILIALQVNTWNETRKDNIKQKALLVNFVEDLKVDSTRISVSQGRLSRIMSLHKELYLIGVKGKNPKDLNDINWIRATILPDLVSRENDPLIANKIASEKLRNEVGAYFRIMNNMIRIEQLFFSLIENTLRPYLGSQQLLDLTVLFEDGKIGIDKDGLIAQSKSPEFQQILFEAYVKCDNTARFLQILINQNTKLRELIYNELKSM